MDYQILTRTKGRSRYMPTLAVATPPRIFLPPALWTPAPPATFKPMRTDRWVCAYGTNGSPRDRMRHDDLYEGRQDFRAYPYQRIAENR